MMSVGAPSFAVHVVCTNCEMGRGVDSTADNPICRAARQASITRRGQRVVPCCRCGVKQRPSRAELSRADAKVKMETPLPDRGARRLLSPGIVSAPDSCDLGLRSGQDQL